MRKSIRKKEKNKAYLYQTIGIIVLIIDYKVLGMPAVADASKITMILRCV